MKEEYGAGGGEKSHDGMSIRRRGAKRRGEEVIVAVWNVSRLKNKDKGFWGEVEKWDVVMVSETWLDRKDWQSMKRLLPKGYVWRMQEV